MSTSKKNPEVVENFTKRSHLKDPICWMLGHVEVPSEEKLGWYSIYCGRCGRNVHKAYWWQLVRYRIPYAFLWLANKTAINSPTYTPQFRAIDQQVKGIGTEHSCAAYSYEGIVSLLKQYKGDGLPEPLLSSLISEEGWISVEDVGTEKFMDMINESFEIEANKQEREETMRIMHGDTPTQRNGENKT